MSRVPWAAIVLALVTTTVGLWLRIGEFYYLQQRLLDLLIVGTVSLTVLLLVRALGRHSRRRPHASFASVGVWAITALLLMACSFETEQANVCKNNAYLARLAGIVIEYELVNGQIPESFDVALRASGQRLPNRGDADGRSIVYERTGDRSFAIRSASRENILAEYRDGVLVPGDYEAR